MKCIYCGAETPSTYQRCTYCGSELPTPPPPPPPVNNFHTTHSSDSHNVTIINHHYGYYPPIVQGPKYSPKKLWITRLLTYLGGWLGLHQFYIGNIGKGLLYFFTAGLFLFGWFIDAIKVTFKKLVDNNGLRIVK
ncbi:MAG: TM2 domain-containing protein [Clostridiaceae bacterium]|jgi:TM2 domain-containing membrane protein YozV|nr:TM2 domain-containing protein [Bacillota bacterium]NLN52451.1 TM2 domain-containing protein [Clostridiaceae bacterium]